MSRHLSDFSDLIFRKARMAKWLLVATMLWNLFPSTTHAIPLFARQTNFECEQCHAGGNFPELNPFGRNFKLTGYTLGTRQSTPLAGMVMAQTTRIANRNGSLDPDNDFSGNGAFQLNEASLFLGGKITDHSGAFVQVTYDGIENHTAVDNVDIRYAHTLSLSDKPVVIGLTLNNNPTVADPYNTAPAWSHPYIDPAGAFQGMGTQPLVYGGLGQVTAGIGAYVDWNNLVYAELAGYRNANSVFSILRYGNTNNDPTSEGTGPNIVSGTSPYWRIALHGDDGPHSWMIGAHGLNANTYTNTYDASSPLVKVKDTSVDAQYQYFSGDHYAVVSGVATREQQTYDPAMVGAGAGADNASNTLNWRQLRLGYTYKNKYAANVTSFASSGSADSQIYAANTSMTPDTSGLVWDFNYFIRRNVKLGLMYVSYNKFNGSSNGYDATGTFTGRNAKDNNILSLYLWAAF